MDGITLPYLPTTLWLLSAALTIIVLLIFLGYHLYFRGRAGGLIKDGEKVAALAARITTFQADEEAIRDSIQIQKSELDRLTVEREDQERLRALLSDLEQQCAAKDQENQSLRNEVGELENQRHNLSQTLEKLGLDKKQYDNDVEKLEERKQKAENLISELVKELSEKTKEVEHLSNEAESQRHTVIDLERTIREQQTELGDLEHRQKSLLEKAEKLQEMEQRFDLMKTKLLEAKEALEDIRNKLEIQKRSEEDALRKVLKYRIEVEELEKKQLNIENKIEDLKKALIINETQQEKVADKLEQAEELLSGLKQELKDTKDELAIQERFEKESALKVQKLNLEVDRLKSEETALKSSIKSLEVLAKQLSKQLDDQDGDTTANEEKYRDLWYPVPFPDLSPVAGSPNEQQLLKNTADYIKGQNLYFPQRVLYAFHTALKIGDISPLIVLAGISGTGKSELPRRYAEGMGLHFVILAVQPRWDSPQDLFGFYNYLEKRYKATELARAMVQFELYNRNLWPLPEDWNHDRSDRMLLVLLDEMNLARVEYYFSEFLSRLETRRGINQEDENERAKAEIVLEMGSLRKGEKSIRLFPGQNILFAGTMNEDETTQALSDKVLDRACVMRFGRPKEIIRQTNEIKKNPAENGLTFIQWKSWQKEKYSPAEEEQVDRWINELNNAMDEISRPFGHRVAQAIQSYVANYPDWMPNRIQIAMADQIEQKIMPKLRGIEIADVGRPIHKIQSIIEQCDDQDLLVAFKKGSKNQQIFIWRGLDRTE